MAYAFRASTVSARVLSSGASSLVRAPVRVVAPVRSTQRQQSRTMASTGNTDVKLDKSTPDDVWRTVLDAQTVGDLHVDTCILKRIADIEMSSNLTEA